MQYSCMSTNARPCPPPGRAINPFVYFAYFVVRIRGEIGPIRGYPNLIGPKFFIFCIRLTPNKANFNQFKPLKKYPRPRRLPACDTADYQSALHRARTSASCAHRSIVCHRQMHAREIYPDTSIDDSLAQNARSPTACSADWQSAVPPIGNRRSSAASFVPAMPECPPSPLPFAMNSALIGLSVPTWPSVRARLVWCC